MASEPLAVQQWTETGPVLRLGEDLLVFSIATPETTKRDTARQRVRHVLRQTLAPRLQCSPADVPLVSLPGQAIRLDVAEREIGISVSHEAGLSLVAINPCGAVGVDLLRLDRLGMADEELLLLTEEYMGVETAQSIAGMPVAQRTAAFARAWARFEARLKCRGEALAEWSPRQEALLERCRVRELLLTKAFVGAVAVIG